MKRYELPTALCPKCQDFAFRIYKKHIRDNSHQCCNCQYIFKPKRSKEMNLKEQIEGIQIKYFGQRRRDGYGGNNIPTITQEILLNKEQIDQATTDILKAVELDEEKILNILTKHAELTEEKEIRFKLTCHLYDLAKAIAQGDVYKDMKERIR